MQPEIVIGSFIAVAVVLAFWAAKRKKQNSSSAGSVPQPFEFDRTRRERWEAIRAGLESILLGTRITITPVPENYNFELWHRSEGNALLLGTVSCPIVGQKEVAVRIALFSVESGCSSLSGLYWEEELPIFIREMKLYVRENNSALKKAEWGY